MQQAIPYRVITHTPSTHHFTISPHSLTTQTYSNNTNSHNNNNSPFIVSNKTDKEMVLNKVSENAVIIFARRGCCMSHVAKRLLLDLGVNPAIHEVEENDEGDVVRELEAIVGGNDVGKVQFPAVFIGGKLFGGLDRLMATHISGDLVPLLKEAGALWL